MPRAERRELAFNRGRVSVWEGRKFKRSVA